MRRQVRCAATREQDWQETTPHDLPPVLKRSGGITTRISTRGYPCCA
jgi:peptide/nickel transport system substrate-binding protein